MRCSTTATAARHPSWTSWTTEDRILFVNTFSKNWAMTGWRIGWLTTHPRLQQVFENLIQYSTSGVAQFMQRGASPPSTRAMASSPHRSSGRGRRAISSAASLAQPGAHGSPCRRARSICSSPSTASTDSRSAAFDIVDKANVGLAPGTAFGPGGEAFLRLCFHRRLDQIEEAAHRLAEWIRKR